MDDSMDFTQELDPRQARRTYLVTYSQADLTKFPTRESFADCVTAEFVNKAKGYQHTITTPVTHYACAMEEHENGGKHYHLVLKLSAPKAMEGNQPC